MSVLSVVGIVALCLIAVSLIVGGLLNLGGCGDRIGDKYKVDNYLQIVVGFLMIALCWYLI